MREATRISALRPSAIRAAGKLIASKPGCITFAGGYPSADIMPVDEMKIITDDLLENRAVRCCNME